MTDSEGAQFRNDMKQEINWRKTIVPEGTQFVHMHCGNCEHRIIVEPVFAPPALLKEPSVYCGECENGPPLWKYALEIDGEFHYKPGYDNSPKAPFDDGDDDE